MTTADDDRYMFTLTPDEFESTRLALIESGCDPDTRRRLLALGVKAGWRCLEVGSGRGSIARWLADLVGPSGHVLATDINPRFLGGIAGPTIEVRQHNIVTDELEVGAFDLVCARAVLEHLPERAGTGPNGGRAEAWWHHLPRGRGLQRRVRARDGLERRTCRR